jgi:DNA replication protein DnaD
MTRYKFNEVNNNTFLKLDIELFVNDVYRNLSNDARVLYSIILNRMELSRENKWINENGEVYLLFSREKVQNLLNFSKGKCIKTFQELNKIGLISEERQGVNLPNKIYVNHIELSGKKLIEVCEIPRITKKRVEKTKKIINFRRYKFYTSCKNATLNGSINFGRPKNELPEVQNLDPNKIEINKILEEDEEAFVPVLKFYIEAMNSIGQPYLKGISPLQVKLLKKLVDKYSANFVMKAIMVTSTKANNFNMDYLEKVLKSYEKKGHTKIEDIENAEKIENQKKEKIEAKRKKNIDKQLETAPKKSKSKNTSLEGDAIYAETNQDTLDGFAELGY